MSECGLTNLAVCLPEKFFEFIANLLNAPIQPLLSFIKSLLTQPTDVTVFYPLWSIIVYIISLFYGLFFLFAGFNFMISGYDAAKREKAKYWLQNVVLMVLFVQASFVIYELIIELSSLLTTGVLEMIDQNFFLMTADNITNFGLQLLLLIPYVIILIFTVLTLALRYFFVVIGVVFFPFAMFFYFIPPLQQYGKMILNTLLIIIFIPFFCAIVLLGGSALLQIPLFENYKIVLVTVAFLAVNLLIMFLLIFALIKAAFGAADSTFGKELKAAAKYLI